MDIKYLLLENKLIDIEKDGKIKWLKQDYTYNENNRFRDIRILAENENLYLFEDSAMFWTMNIRSFSAFEEVYILTYLFDGQIQKYYYDMHNLVEYNPLLEPRKEIERLLTIYEDYQSHTGRKSLLNSNYDSSKNPKPYYQLSGTWLKKASNSGGDARYNNH